MKMRVAIFFSIILLYFSFENDSATPLKLPKHFPEPIYNFKNNPLSHEKIELGRVLFYDPILSIDSTISCSSCHSPYNAFAHTDHQLSHGVYDQIADRNAPGLFNLAWQPIFMWDGSINHLDFQALSPIHNPKEMGESLPNVIGKLQHKKNYSTWFYEAFGDSTITGERLLKALSQFQLTLISADSRYDEMKLGELTYTEKEKRGYQLFKKNCSSCHEEPLFTNYTFADNGIGLDSLLNDLGRQKISNNKEDFTLFKIPSLRNISYTSPYMHDGRFEKLMDVLDHYSKDSKNMTNSDLKKAVTLSSDDKIDLISFLLSLNDPSFIIQKNNKFPMKLLE